MITIIKQSSALLYASLFFLLSGCCSFPLVDCGPLTTELQISPKETSLNVKGVDYILTFKGFSYYNRRSKDFLFTNIYVHFNNNVEVLLEESGIYYFQDGKKIHVKDIHRNNEYYSISLPNQVFPNQIYLNGIIKVDQDEEKFNLILNIIDNTLD
ncbi:hypothetical protein [Proteiniphilum sp. X52]|uniref:hypothetical protein n=1 Tax=Proteiniphilum sp. X52 TaxID=2382159 RepID=UPI000F0A601D|nr:hypothetical protein [Proteiniphilum sp. X52]RNC63248.1 hypothetical protein D7D25_17550 [Proteiniphilum sp. X52]